MDESDSIHGGVVFYLLDSEFAFEPIEVRNGCGRQDEKLGRIESLTR